MPVPRSKSTSHEHTGSGNNRLEYRLRGYALGASAAGVGLLALVQPTRAEVIYTPIYKTTSLGMISIDLDNDGATDFVVALEINSNGTSFMCTNVYKENLAVLMYTGEVVEARTGAAALPQGVVIDSQRDFKHAQRPGERMAVGKGKNYRCCTESCTAHIVQSNGPWLAAKDMYMGLRFEINGEIHYGWARFSVGWVRTYLRFNHRLTAHLTGYAYESIPGQAIRAGQRSGVADDPIYTPESTNPSDEPLSSSIESLTAEGPEPGSLGLLALGWAGPPISCGQAPRK